MASDDVVDDDRFGGVEATRLLLPILKSVRCNEVALLLDYCCLPKIARILSYRVTR